MYRKVEGHSIKLKLLKFLELFSYLNSQGVVYISRVTLPHRLAILKPLLENIPRGSATFAILICFKTIIARHRDRVFVEIVLGDRVIFNFNTLL